MSYINNGLERTLDVQVIRYLNGVQQSIITYSGKNSFGSYAAITDGDLAIMTDTVYQQRLNDFCTYIESINGGLTLSRNIAGSAGTNNPERTSNGMCTIGDSTSKLFNLIIGQTGSNNSIYAISASGVTSSIIVNLESEYDNSTFASGSAIISSGNTQSNLITPTLPSGASSVTAVTVTSVSPTYDATYIYKI